VDLVKWSTALGVGSDHQRESLRKVAATLVAVFAMKSGERLDLIGELSGIERSFSIPGWKAIVRRRG
jgi:hypothetical protein